MVVWSIKCSGQTDYLGHDKPKDDEQRDCQKNIEQRSHRPAASRPVVKGRPRGFLENPGTTHPPRVDGSGGHKQRERKRIVFHLTHD